MNFSDFGVKDESELEQDEFSLSKPTFGKDNQLTVIGWKGTTTSWNKYYIVKCSECSKDPELFGDGVFKITKRYLANGNLSCGCAGNVKWTKHQYITLIKRKVVAPLFFEYIIGDLVNSNTKVNFTCKQHGTYITNISSFLQNSGKCPHCSLIAKGLSSRKEEIAFISDFMSTGKFKEGTKFWKSERVDSTGVKSYWHYTCPTCSNDEYVKAGLCSGVFESFIGSLRLGYKPCRCSSKCKLTKKQSEFKIKNIITQQGLKESFVGWQNNYEGGRSKCLLDCKEHGIYTVSADKFINRGSRCPQCGWHCQRQAYIHTIKDNNKDVAIKFGIARNSHIRYTQQNNQATVKISKYGIWSFPDVKSCKSAEKFIKQSFKCRFLTKEQMPDGYTETTSISNIEAIIKIYEDFGGVRVDE